MEGVAKPLVSMGKLVKDDAGNVIETREYSDHLMTTLLKGHRPQKYRDNINVSGTIVLDLSSRLDVRRRAGSVFRRTQAARLQS